MIIGKFTPQVIETIYEETKQRWNKRWSSNQSKPVPMFYLSDYASKIHKRGEFNLGNWNSGQNLIEYFVRDYIYDTQKTTHLIANFDCEKSVLSDTGYQHIGETGTIIVHIDFYNDTWYYSIIVEFDSRFDQDIYLITHYKNRGCTESISKNGHLINIDEYSELLNIVDSIDGHGFYLNSNGIYLYK